MQNIMTRQEFNDRTGYTLNAHATRSPNENRVTAKNIGWRSENPLRQFTDSEAMNRDPSSLVLSTNMPVCANPAHTNMTAKIVRTPFFI